MHKPTVSNELAGRAPVFGYRPASLADMRIAVLIAASVLVGAVHRGWPRRRARPSVGPNQDDSVNAAHDHARIHDPAKAPEAGAEVGDVIKFIESGRPADVNQFHTATRDGAAKQLGDDVAFTTPSGKSHCMTDSKNFGGALACLVDLAIPPLQPPDVYGQWKGGWVDFAGSQHRNRFGAWRSRSVRQR